MIRGSTLTVVVLLLSTAIAAAQAPAKPPIADVISQLSDKDPQARSKAAYALGKYTDDSSRLDPLEKGATTDPDATVRANALSSLSPRDVPRAIGGASSTSRSCPVMPTRTCARSARCI